MKPWSPQEAFSSTFKEKRQKKKFAALPSSPEQGSRERGFFPKIRNIFKREKSSKDSLLSDISVCCLNFLYEIFVLYFPSHCCVLVC